MEVPLLASVPAPQTYGPPIPCSSSLERSSKPQLFSPKHSFSSDSPPFPSDPPFPPPDLSSPPPPGPSVSASSPDAAQPAVLLGVSGLSVGAAIPAPYASRPSPVLPLPAPGPVLAPPPPVPSGSAPAASASPASQYRHIPADLLCFQPLLSPSRSFEPPPGHQFPAAPVPPSAAPESSPAALAASADSSAILPLSNKLPPGVPSGSAAPPSSAFPPLPSSLPKRPHQADAPLLALSSDSQHRTPPVRHNAQANPLLPKSYAQAAKGSSGLGFVRAHARDVDHFARLPRTGLNVICSSHEGIPACSFVHSELPIVEGLYAKALVMKFHGGRPSLAASHKEISSWGFESHFSIGPLTSRSFLLRFQEERDLLKTISRPSSSLLTFPYKIFRWHNRCHLKEESFMVPIWISLPRLPLQCFAPEFLESMASLIGRFLCLDKATATLARPSAARMCIELDLRKERPQFIWIGLFEGFKQPIVYERVPKFCIGCLVQGHSSVDCSKASLDTLQPLGSGPSPAVHERPQSDRRNAKEIFAAGSKEIPNQSRASSVATSSASLSDSVFPQQDPLVPSQQQLHPPATSPVSRSSEQQSAVIHAPRPLTTPPTHPDPLAAAPHLPAAHPIMQSSVDEASHPPLPPSPSNAKAISPSSPFPAAAASSFASDQQPSSGPHRSSEVQSAGSPAHAPVLHPTQSLSAQAAPFAPSDLVPPTQQTPKPSSVQPLFPAIKLMPRPSSSPVRAKTAVISATAPLLHQPPRYQLHPPPPASSRSKHKSVSFMPQQSNIQANQSLWEVVNNHINQFNKTRLACEGVTNAYEEFPDPSSFSHFVSDSEASVEAEFPPSSPMAPSHEDENPFPPPPQSYVSEGEDPNVEAISLQGHISDDAFYQRPKTSKRNKRHPDGPLKVQLRARRGSSSIHR